MATRAEIETWLAQVTLGDRAAFASLYDATSAKLYAVTLRILNDRDAAEDALQEVYVKIWHKAGQYSVNGLSPMTWLIAVARNHAIDRLRARKAAGSRPLDEADAVADAGPGPEALAVASGERAALAACLGELEADKAQMVRRCYLDGWTYRDLAETADVPLNTVRTWLRRSLMKLRECLSR
ncbi:sigma-70 family RNA polymerase sigma factor [Rhodobacterales bacterium HKCCE2091]|nr:sigma-70 family RNA polymerase sigma factor [Rhodobacterales bacterium HKCCE2091]